VNSCKDCSISCVDFVQFYKATNTNPLRPKNKDINKVMRVPASKSLEGTAAELEEEDEEEEPPPELLEPPDTFGLEVTVPVPAVPACEMRSEQVPEGLVALWVVAKPSKLQAEAALF